MKLTNQSLDAFGDQCKYNYDEFMELPESCQNALIIDWFDSVGHIGDETIIQILINELIANRSFLEATNAAIEKANIIYNEVLKLC